MAEHSGIKVLTYGTFDTFHYGHLKLLMQAAALGETLFVGVSTDAFNELKGKSSHFNLEERCAMLSQLRIVSHIFPEERWEQKREDIVKYGIDLLVMGDDWAGKFDHLGDLCRVQYLKRTPIISSQRVRDMINGK